MKIKEEHRPLIEKIIQEESSSFYYYDIDGLQSHLESIKKIKHDDLGLWYACKANPISEILKTFHKLGYGIDVASLGELNQAIACGFDPKNILSTGPAKSKDYLNHFLNHDVNIIVLESLNQAYWLNEVAADFPTKPLVLIRVQLDWQEGTSVLGGNQITPFGLNTEEWDKLDMSRCQNLDIQGFHVFQWGNILEPEHLNSIWIKIATEIQSFANQKKLPFNILDLGGGLGIPYHSSEVPIDFKDINRLLVDLKENFKIKKIWMELGRYAVGEYGHYVTQVIDRKSVRGQEILVLEGGINHLIRPAITNQPFPCESLKKSNAKLITFHLHGPLCTALDKLGSFELPEDTEPGDWLVFHQAGAYGFTESMPFFLCHNLPAEVIIKENQFEILRQSTPSKDWLV